MNRIRAGIAASVIALTAPLASAPARAAEAEPEQVTVTYERGLLAGRGDVDVNESTLAVTNAGDNPVYGIRLSVEFPAGSGFAPVPGPRNCSVRGGLLDCYFAVVLAPHTTYEVDVPFHVEDRHPHHTEYNDSYRWQLGGLPAPASGDGPALALRPEAEPLPAAPPAQAGSFFGQFIDFRRTGGATPDLAALGPDEPVTGTPGSTVRPRIAARNVGPVGLGYHAPPSEDGSPAPVVALVRLDLPDGVSVLEAPPYCRLYSMSWPEVDPAPYADRKEFTCADENPIAPGDTRAFPFALRIDEPAENATASVTVVMPGDGNEANNIVEFPIDSAA